MADNQCFECGKNLSGHPKIRLDGDIYCYICAKELTGTLDELVEQQLKPKLKEYEAQVARYEKWEKEFKAASPSRDMQFYIVVGVALAFGAFVGNDKTTGQAFLLFLVGLVIGYIVNFFYVANRQEKWRQRNPQSAFPSQPAGDFASDRVELVGGGTKGKQITGRYRLQILKRDGYKCQNCGDVFPAEELEVHHIQPRAKRGKHFSTNLVTLCLNCHLNESWFGHIHKMRKR